MRLLTRVYGMLSGNKITFSKWLMAAEEQSLQVLSVAMDRRCIAFDTHTLVSSGNMLHFQIKIAEVLSNPTPPFLVSVRRADEMVHAELDKYW